MRRCSLLYTAYVRARQASGHTPMRNALDAKEEKAWICKNHHSQQGSRSLYDSEGSVSDENEYVAMMFYKDSDFLIETFKNFLTKFKEA